MNMAVKTKPARDKTPETAGGAPVDAASQRVLGVDHEADDFAMKDRDDVEEIEALASAPLDNPPPVGVGGEFVLDGSTVSNPHPELLDTIENPSLIAAFASHHRLGLAKEVWVLESAVDAAETIGAKNSLEKMLAHQLAAAHSAAMVLQAVMIQQTDPVEISRLINASARMMTVFQQGFEALHRVRRGGKQTVVVQHVTVEGGHVAVAGNVTKTEGPDGG
jgi:hypothetical protein